MIPARPILAAAALLACAAPALAQVADLDALRSRALDMTNASRKDHDLPPLQRRDDLDAAAQRHADDMLRRDYYAHVSPEGGTARDRYLAEGGDEGKLVAENIARCSGCPRPDAGSIKRLHQGWMDSPEHRDNILREGLAGFGFGMAGGGAEPQLAVQTFAGPGTARGEAGELAQEDVSDAARTAVNRLRREAGHAPVEASDALTEAARNLVPETIEDFRLDHAGDLEGALPMAEAGQWRMLATLAASCGGCGAQPAQGDPAAFVRDWNAGETRETLLDPSVTRIGAVLRADGAGRKVMLLVLGQPR
ncbi:CAP domain-containing protein [Rhodobacter sp. NSM]|uniref:CAP domain-containing protein n=1 Tax=Rhodobacter sp. NSM TaxID=3457501 RepID=UPI003FD0EBE3